MSEINENVTQETLDETSVDVVYENSVEVLSEEETPSAATLSASEYKVIIDSVKEFKEQYETLKKTVSSFVTETSDLDESVLTHVLKFTNGIRNESVFDLRVFLEEHQNNVDGRFDHLSDEEIYDLVERINNSSVILHDMEKQYKEIMTESGEIMNEYIQYMNSNKMNNTIEKRIEAMKAAAELEEDSYQKSKIVKMVQALESCTHYGYMFERFNEVGIEKEVDNIKNTYFDNRRSQYSIKKYVDKIKAFGFNPEIYKYFFNLEENFLEEKYHVYNNLTLFMYMRLVGYSDPYNKKDQLVVKSFTGAFTNLIYHRFEDQEKENEFLNAMRRVLDLFEDHYIYFEINNLTHPKHPTRISNDKRVEERRKNEYITAMRKMNITGYDHSWTANELMEYMNTEIERLKEEQARRAEEEKITIGTPSEEENLEEVYEETIEEIDESDTEEDIDAELDEYIKKANEEVDAIKREEDGENE